MKISENIQWVLQNPGKWCFLKNKPYKARIQRANLGKIYNVPNQPGIVYNFLEDTYESVEEHGYVITGIAGEMWPIGRNNLEKYGIFPEQVTENPQETCTKQLDVIYAGIQIPIDTHFTLEVDYGKKALLIGNRLGVNHGSGDYILVATKQVNGCFMPDFSDSGRIVNGAIIFQLYQKWYDANQSEGHVISPPFIL